MKRTTFLWICAFLIIGCNSKKSDPLFSTAGFDTLTRRIDSIFQQWDFPGSPGGSVAIVKEGKVVFMKGYGYADLEMVSPITPETKFYMASISKQFTGYCIAKLIFERKLSLDDDIRKYLPELPSFETPVLVRDLVFHKSGFRDFYGLIPLTGSYLNDYFTNSDVLKILSNQRELNFRPGERWEYSNTNYFLLGEIVKRITGESLKQWTMKNIFIPLEMNNSFFVDSIETIVTNRAKSYHQNDDGGFYNDPFLDVTVGHTGLYSTAEDMTKWIIHLHDMNKERDPVLRIMLQIDTLNSGEEIDNYSFGLFKSSDDENQYWHRGSLFGFKSIISYYPEKDFGLVISGNVQRFNRRQYAREITQLFYPEIITVSSTGQTGFFVGDSLMKINISLNKNSLQIYTGHYVVEPMLIYVITEKENSLCINEYRDSEMTNLINIGRNMFRNDEGSVLVSFYENNEGLIDSLTYQSASDHVTGLKARILSTAQEDEKVGDYYNTELDISVIIKKTPAGLIAQNSNLGQIELVPTFEDEFRCDHDFFSYISFYRDSENKISGFLLNGFSVSNIRFVKKYK